MTTEINTTVSVEMTLALKHQDLIAKNIKSQEPDGNEESDIVTELRKIGFEFGRMGDPGTGTNSGI